MSKADLIGIDDNWRFDALLGAVAGLVFIMISSASSISIGIPAPIYPQSALPEIVNLVAGLVVVAILAPIFEEPLFRGAVLFISHKVTGNLIAALVITAIAFAGFHWAVYGEALMAAFVGAFIFSIIASLLTLQTKSILPAVVMHAMVNGYLYLGSQQLLTVAGV